MIIEEILLIITKELTGQASEDEQDLLKDWLSESRENSSLYHSYKEAFLNGKYQPKIKNEEEAYNELSNRLRFEKDAAKTGVKKRKLGKHRQISFSSLKIAAVVLILISTSFIIYKSWSYWQPENELPAVTHKVIIKSNPRGAKSLITLPDGSKVKLNSESHLEYFSDFKQDRSVKLIGEAFFEVVKDSLRPFYVMTGDLRVRVLGTSFNVEAFPFENKVKVALVTGKVLVEKKEGLEIEPLQYLVPDQMLIYDHLLSEFNIAEFDPIEVLGWKDGKLHFDETEFDEVIKELERWYGVEFIISPKVDTSGRFKGTYTQDLLEVVLEGLSFQSDFKCKIEGKKVYIN